ncbi:MAG: methyltransferase domain-containing protein [Phycisphaerae bacterium]|nr:methyltransferase domain-containing protein [Phycisphaerae bacterium]
MGRSKRKAVQRYHDRVATRYDQSYEDAFWRWHDSLTWVHLKSYLPRNLRARVIDLGCGTGKWAAKLIKSGFSVSCLDISPAMLDQCRRRFGEDASSAPVAYLQADLCTMPQVEDDSYDFAVALGDPIGCSESPPRALAEIRRILVDGAVLVATFDNRLAAIDFYLQAGNRGDLERFLRDGRTRWLTRDPKEQFPITTWSPAQISDVLSAAGFELLDMIGKTVLPMRHYRALLAESSERRAWARVEKSLCRDPGAIGRASHIQVACRVHKKRG